MSKEFKERYISAQTSSANILLVKGDDKMLWELFLYQLDSWDWESVLGPKSYKRSKAIFSNPCNTSIPSLHNTAPHSVKQNATLNLASSSLPSLSIIFGHWHTKSLSILWALNVFIGHFCNFSLNNIKKNTFFWRYNSHAIKVTHLKCTVQCLLVYSQRYTTITIVNFRTFSSPQKETCSW